MVDSFHIPQYVKARSPEGLRVAMMRVNARAGAFHKFFGIQFVNGSWFAWYYKKLETSDVEAMSRGESSDG